MKKILWLLAFICSVSSSTSAFAIGQDRSYLNRIMLYNDSPYAISYLFWNNSISSNTYYIQRGSTDLYHSGIGDSFAKLVFSACTEGAPYGGRCRTYEWHTLPQMYNAELISTIHIKSIYDVAVTCLDGSATSCIVN
jgi:hypothetical protein